MLATREQLRQARDSAQDEVRAAWDTHGVFSPHTKALVAKRERAERRCVRYKRASWPLTAAHDRAGRKVELEQPSGQPPAPRVVGPSPDAAAIQALADEFNKRSAERERQRQASIEREREQARKRQRQPERARRPLDQAQAPPRNLAAFDVEQA